jgi:hypothetical protein
VLGERDDFVSLGPRTRSPTLLSATTVDTSAIEWLVHVTVT